MSFSLLERWQGSEGVIGRGTGSALHKNTFFIYNFYGNYFFGIIILIQDDSFVPLFLNVNNRNSYFLVRKLK